MSDRRFSRVESVDLEKGIVYAHGKNKPSSEAMLHYSIYKARPEINAIFHGHYDDFERLSEKLGIPVTKKEEPYGTMQLVDRVIDILDDHKFLQMKNHGFIALGEDMDEAGNLTLEMYEKMKHFYETSDLPQEVTKPLRNGAVAEVHFEGDPDTYVMIKEGGRSIFRKETPAKPQIVLKYYGDAVDYLIGDQVDGELTVKEYATRLGECVLTPTKERRIDFKLCCNVVTAARMGYFGMMLKGGRTAVSLVKKLGIKIPQKYLPKS